MRLPSFLLEGEMDMPLGGGGGGGTWSGGATLLAQRKKSLTETQNPQREAGPVPPAGGMGPGTTIAQPIYPQTPAPLGQSGFTGQNNLIGSQINPDPSQRLGTTQNLVDTARGNVAGYQTPQFGRIGAPTQGPNLGDLEGTARGPGLPDFQGIGTGQLNLSPEAQRARQLTSQNLEGLNNAPNRQQLAEQTFQSLGDIENARLGQGIRAAGQRAAAFGRLGSGMVDEETSDLFGQHKARLADIRRQLATDTAGQELQDRLGRLGATSNVAGQFRGEDLDTAGFEQGLRGEARGERGAGLDEAYRRAGLGLDQARTIAGLRGQQFGQDQSLRQEARGERSDELGASQQDFANRRAQLGDLSGLESQQYGQERGARDELRGERGYQYGLQRDALGDRLGQYGLEQDAQQRAFDQEMERNRLLAQLGLGDSSGTELDIAGTYGQQGQDASQGAGDIIRGLFGTTAAPQGQTLPPAPPGAQWQRQPDGRMQLIKVG